MAIMLEGLTSFSPIKCRSFEIPVLVFPYPAPAKKSTLLFSERTDFLYFSFKSSRTTDI